MTETASQYQLRSRATPDRDRLPKYLELDRAHKSLKSAVIELQGFVHEITHNGHQEEIDDMGHIAPPTPSLNDVMRYLPDALDDISAQIREYTALLRDIFL